jgi:hypothetical protein
MGPFGTQPLTGEVRRETVAAGTKSERAALVLVTGDQRLRLRRRGAPAYGPDPELDALEGKTITATGTALASTFLMDSWTISEP